MARGRRFGWHSGSAEAYNLTVYNDLTVEGDFTFGNASTDTLTVTGKLDANADVDLGSGDDTINLGASSGDTLNFNADLVGATGIDVSISGAGRLKLGGSAGTVSLVAGTVTVGVAGVLTTDGVQLTHLAAAGSIGTLVGVVTAGTLTISSRTAGGSVEANDDNAISWLVHGNL